MGRTTDIFRAISDLALKPINLDLDSIKRVIDAVAGDLPPGASAQQRANHLMKRAIIRAVGQLVDEQVRAGTLQESQASRSDHVAAWIYRDIEVEIDDLKHPERLPAIKELLPQLHQWQVAHGLTEAAARAVCERLPHYIPKALHDEWQARVEDYRPIWSAFETPIGERVRRDKNWLAYYAMLRQAIEEPVFSEAFSLRQIYIPARATRGWNLSEFSFFPAGDLHDQLFSWIIAADPKDTVRIVSGGPGSGKSSFSRILADALAQNEKLRVVRVPLGDIDIEHEHFPDCIIRYCTPALGEDIFLRKDDRRLVLVLDGLDELEMHGQTVYQAAKKFLDDIFKMLPGYNQLGCTVQVVILGRELAVDAAKEECRRLARDESMILHLLPFNDVERDLWWTRFSALTGHQYRGMPDTLRNLDDDVTRQPLISYLLSLALHSGTIDFEAPDFNINRIYDHAVRSAHGRKWNDNRPSSLEPIASENFVQLMESLAVAIWHGEGNTTTESQFERQCMSDNLGKHLALLRRQGASAIPSLLVSFFIRRRKGREEGTNPERRYEFTHKSFREYLVARRLAAMLRDNRLKEVDLLCRPAPSDIFIKAALMREFDFWPEHQRKTLSMKLKRLLEQRLDLAHSLPSTKDSTHYVNSTEAIFAMTNAVTLSIQHPSNRKIILDKDIGSTPKHILVERTEIRLSKPTTLAYFLRFLEVKRRESRNSVIYESLSAMAFPNQILDGIDLSEANLSASRFNRFTRCNLRKAAMVGTEVHSDVIHCDLTAAYLNGAIIRGMVQMSHLHEANLSGARVTGGFWLCDLVGANFAQARVDRPFVACRQNGTVTSSIDAVFEVFDDAGRTMEAPPPPQGAVVADPLLAET